MRGPEVGSRVAVPQADVMRVAEKDFERAFSLGIGIPPEWAMRLYNFYIHPIIIL